MVDKIITKVLVDEGLVDISHEVVEDVSLLIGGTTNQSIHIDHSRLYAYFSDANEELVAHEVNRNKYNDALSRKHAPSSILSDLSNDKLGFYLTLPFSAVDLDENKGNAIIKFNCTNNHFPIAYENRAKKPDVANDLVSILVKNGCRFVGDIAHAGGRYLSKLKGKQATEFFTMYKKYTTLLTKEILILIISMKYSRP
jgi:hypothetical protein